MYGECLNNQNKKNKNRIGLWNTDFQSYNPPTAYKVLEQEKAGGAGVVMILALIIGLIIAACV